MPSKKFAAALLACLPVCFSASSAHADEVRLYNWMDFLSEEVISTFARETGHELVQLYFDDEEIRDSVITSGRARGYDLILVESSSLQLMAEQGHFQDLSPLIAELADKYDPRWLDACGKYGLPYAWGTTGLLYRSSIARQPISSWQQLFYPPAEHQGRVVMYLDALDAPATALLAGKIDPFTEDKQALKQAFALLQAQQSHLLAEEYGHGYAEKHGEASQMSLTLGYAGDDESLIETTGQQDWVYVVPDEGSTLWGECLAAPIGTPVNEATEAFLSFISRPEVAALNAEETWFSTPNKAALELTSDEYRQDPGLYPPAKVLDKSVPYRRLSSEALSLRIRMINSLRHD